MVGVKWGCLVVLVVLLLGGLVLVVVGVWFWYDQSCFVDVLIILDQFSVVIVFGDGLNMVLGKLCVVGVDEGNDIQWILLVCQFDVVGKFKVGEYVFDVGFILCELFICMCQGCVFQYWLIIVEGWNICQVCVVFKCVDLLCYIIDDMDDVVLMKVLGFLGEYFEGCFLLEIYVYQCGDSDLDVFKCVYVVMEKVLIVVWDSCVDDLLLNLLYELLIFVLIIEKEIVLFSECFQIVGVFVCCLKIGMCLQIDLMVIYGIGSCYDGNICKCDLIIDMLYNIYICVGFILILIVMFGCDVLYVVVQLVVGDVLYFVVVGDGSGVYVFLVNYIDYNVVVVCYLQQLCQQCSQVVL